LPVPAPYGDYGRITEWRIEESLPDAIAAYAKWLVNESGWTVTERENPDQRVPIRARHICILFRRLNSHGSDVTRPYLRALEARRTATSFRGVVDELEDRAERDEASETPLAEEGTEGVRIMTVHRAKGLEFPVVILADMTCKETVGEPSRYVDPARNLCALRL